jgi:hypothetical protein
LAPRKTLGAAAPLGTTFFVMVSFAALLIRLL